MTIGTASDTLPADRRVPMDSELNRRRRTGSPDAERAFKVRLDVRATNDTRETARETIKITP